VIRLPGEKQALGYPGKVAYEPLEEFELQISQCQTFFMASDGVLDQPGGEFSRAFGPKRLMQLIETHRHLSAMKEVKRAVDAWRGEEKRRDDVSALAFSI
jgi:serine phosphatase RsbU (regulator of sigma subunit)